MSGPGGFATEEDARTIENLKAVVSTAKVMTKKAAADKSDK